MRFKVRDLMSNVMQQEGCPFDSTRLHGCPPPPCPPPSCPGQSGCPQPSQKPPKASLEMLSVLRSQMRQALLPA